jgi:hypothetical protein
LTNATTTSTRQPSGSRGATPWAGLLHLPHGTPALNILANALIEVDYLGPIEASIDKPHRTAFGAAKVCADILPVPIRQIIKIQPTGVMTTLVIGSGTGRSETEDHDHLKAGRPSSGANYPTG